MPEKDYGAAVAALNSLQTNSAVIAEVRRKGQRMNDDSIPDMLRWMDKIGYKEIDFKSLNAIHVAGTKGKGSTSAFISTILAQYLPGSKNPKLHKIGLYTSPHLRFVRERIQVNNQPLSEELFAKYFFDVWDRLSAVGDGSKPSYFRYLTIVAFHAFKQEQVDSAVIECGVGGQYDCTNIFESPSVTAVTALGIDHVMTLGHTLPEIAWHKAGIFKKDAPALVSPQPTEAMQVLEKRAAERAAPFHVVRRLASIESGETPIGLAAGFQKSNASLAAVVASAHLRRLGHDDVPDLIAKPDAQLPHEFTEGLVKVRWPGRCETRRDSKSPITWCLDGGHTLESLDLAAVWFLEEALSTNSTRPRLLIFNQQVREAGPLVRTLFKRLATKFAKPIQNVIFTTNITYSDGGYRPDLTSVNNDPKDVGELKIQRELAQIWRELDPNATVDVSPSIDKAIAKARLIASGSEGESLCLVTGSLHLVGGAIEVLESGV